MVNEFIKKGVNLTKACQTIINEVKTPKKLK